MIPLLLFLNALLSMFILPNVLLIPLIPLLLNSLLINLDLSILLPLEQDNVTLPLLQWQYSGCLTLFSSLHFVYNHLLSLLLTYHYTLFTKYTLGHSLATLMLSLAFIHPLFFYDFLPHFFEYLQLHFPSLFQMLFIHIHHFLVLYFLAEFVLYQLLYLCSAVLS